MKVTLKADPFPHVLMSEFYTAEELSDVSEELKLLSKHALGPDKTGSAVDMKEIEGGFGQEYVYRKKNKGIFLSSFFKVEKESAISKANRKLFDKEFMQTLNNFNFMFGYLLNTNWDSSLVQFYSNGDYYKGHRDIAVFSNIVNCCSDPKEYDGGMLRFVDYDYSVDLRRNESILFPSCLEHEVTPVTVNHNDVMRSRITITTFIGISAG